MTPRIAAFIVTPDDDRALREVAARRYELHLFESPAALAQATFSGRFSHVICELLPGRGPELGVSLRTTGSTARLPAGTIVRCGLGTHLIPDLLAVRSPLDLRLSVRGYDSLQQFDRTDSDVSCRYAIVREAVAHAPHFAQVLVAAVSVLGERRCSVGQLANFCGVSVRTLEWRLHRHALPTARNLLGWCLALHCTWKIQFLGWTLKQTSLDAGFSCTAAFCNYAQRHVGMSPGRISRTKGFHGLLADFVQRIRGLTISQVQGADAFGHWERTDPVALELY